MATATPWLFKKLQKFPKKILKFSIISGIPTVKMHIPAPYCDCPMNAINILNVLYKLHWECSINTRFCNEKQVLLSASSV